MSTPGGSPILSNADLAVLQASVTKDVFERF